MNSGCAFLASTLIHLALVPSGAVMTHSLGMFSVAARGLSLIHICIRFLTDYLSGDVYFKIHRPEHNLDRCRPQMALMESIAAQMDEMKAIVDRY